MKLLAAFVAVSFQIAQARRLQTADTVPTYTPEECDVWLAGGSAFDTDASGGLSSDEYFAVLSSLGLTTVAQSYSDLTFEDKMVFASLACSCVSLGMGEDCCSGDDAEIPLSVLSTVGDPAVDAYKADLCNLLATVILEETVTTPPPAVVAATESPVAGATPPPEGASALITFDVPGVVGDFDAAEIAANEGSNDILAHIIKGFEIVSNDILSAESARKVRGLRASKRALQEMAPVEVTDIGEFIKLTNVTSFKQRSRALLTSIHFSLWRLCSLPRWLGICRGGGYLRQLQIYGHYRRIKRGNSRLVLRRDVGQNRRWNAL